MSRFARIKSEDERLDAMADDAGFADVDENDPASVGRLMKKMSREFGDELGDDFDDAVDEAMAESAAGAEAGENGEAGGSGDLGADEP